jgi:hypothetical protein
LCWNSWRNRQWIEGIADLNGVIELMEGIRQMENRTGCCDGCRIAEVAIDVRCTRVVDNRVRRKRSEKSEQNRPNSE